MQTNDILQKLNKCTRGCNCNLVNYPCVPACTFIKLPFEYPEGYTKENFSELFFVIATNLEVDSRPLLFTDSNESPINFDLDNNFIILNSVNAPCEFCVDGGIYAYELTGTLQSSGDNHELLLIQIGYLCVQQSIRQLIVDCE